MYVQNTIFSFLKAIGIRSKSDESNLYFLNTRKTNVAMFFCIYKQLHAYDNGIIIQLNLNNALNFKATK